MKTIKNILNLINTTKNNILGGKRNKNIQYIDALDNNMYIYHIDEVLTQKIDEHEAFCIISRNKKVLLTMEAKARLEKLITV